jgi:hypothetical protein
MKIERLEFIGFGNLAGQRIDFASNKLNIVVQPNDYGKSTISEAIWAVLYDYPHGGEPTSARRGGERKPVSGAAFKACLDVSLGERRLRLIRDFNDGSMKILDLSKDLSKADADITQQFADALSEDGLGQLLTGVDRQLFRTTCFVSQRQLQAPPFAHDRAVSSLLVGLADNGSATNNVFDAIAAIEQRLLAFPDSGQLVPIDELIVNAGEKCEELSLQLTALEEERQTCDRDVESLAELENRIDERVRVVSADEYFHLCLEAADIDSRVARAQERMQRVEQLETQLRALSRYENFPIAKQKQIEELWLRRQSRQEDLKRLKTEIGEESTPPNRPMQALAAPPARPEIFEGLEHFTVEDAQTLYALAHTLDQVLSENAAARMRFDSELNRLGSLGVNVDAMDSMRHALLRFEARELDELHSINSMVTTARERVGECTMNADKARTTATEIAEARGTLARTVQKYFWPCLIMAMLCLVPLVYLLRFEQRSLTDGLVTIVVLVYLICCGASAASWVVSSRIQRSYRVDEEAEAKEQEHKYLLATHDLISRTKNYESRIQALAAKAKVKDGAELLRIVQEYAMASPQFKELDLLDHVLKNAEAHATKLKSQIQGYFKAANRKVHDINAKTALALADEINKNLESVRNSNSSALLGDHREPEIAFVTDELNDANRLLQDEFAKMGLTFDTLEKGYAQFSAAFEQFEKREALQNELDLLTDDSTTESLPSELPKLLARLEEKRADIWARMQELVAASPEIVALPAPTGDSTRSSLGKEIADLRGSVDDLRRERNELTVQIRTAMRHYQENYLKTSEELETVQQRLTYLKSTRVSLQLARDTLMQLANETHSVWADRLSDIARNTLKEVQSDFDLLEFDADLCLNVRRKGSREMLNPWQLNSQLSAGTREQLHWLARMTVLQFLSEKRQLPIVLDEPFSEFDDERFLRSVRFLINSVVPRHQLLMFSCHQQRHDWLMERLQPHEREAVQLCALTAIKPESFARR